MKNLWNKWTGIALVKRIVVGLILGAILGVAAPGATSIAILGDVFVGALKAIAPLLVFFLVLSSLCNAGKSHGGVIKTVVALYMFSTVLAAVIAVFASMIFPVHLTLTNAAADASAPQGIVEVLSNLLLNIVANQSEKFLKQIRLKTYITLRLKKITRTLQIILLHTIVKISVLLENKKDLYGLVRIVVMNIIH